MSDQRIKLDTYNSELLSQIAIATDQNPQELIKTYLDEKSKYLQIEEHTISDEIFLGKLCKYQSATRELFISYVHEKLIDSDNAKSDFDELLNEKQKTIALLTQNVNDLKDDASSLRNEIDTLSKKLMDLEQQLEAAHLENVALRNTNETLKNTNEKLDNILTLISSAKKQAES